MNAAKLDPVTALPDVVRCSQTTRAMSASSTIFRRAVCPAQRAGIPSAGVASYHDPHPQWLGARMMWSDGSVSCDRKIDYDVRGRSEYIAVPPMRSMKAATRSARISNGSLAWPQARHL